MLYFVVYDAEELGLGLRVLLQRPEDGLQGMVSGPTLPGAAGYRENLHGVKGWWRGYKVHRVRFTRWEVRIVAWVSSDFRENQFILGRGDHNGEYP